MERSTTQLEKIEAIGPLGMTFAAIVVGIVGGIGAIIFRALIGLIHNFMLYGKIDINYDANIHAVAPHLEWWIIFVPVIGSIAVTWLVKNFAPEARGHGVPEVMDAIYNKQGIIRPIVAIVKSLASAISIGTGGSVGREGPIVQIGAAMGSTMGRIIRMPARQRIILIACGAGAGIAATFNTPIGGLTFAVELMLVSINVSSITLVAIATITACYIGQMYFGALPAFNVHDLEVFIPKAISASDLLLYAPFGVLVGIFAAIFIKSIYWFEDLFDELPMNAYFRHMLGMFLLGILLYLFMKYTGNYYIQGVGYSTIQDILRGILQHPYFLMLLVVAKLLATCLTLGSGASGGVFSPSLYIGATLGGVVGNILKLALPHAHIHPEIFALAGMAGMVAGSTGAVLTAIIMILEMTHDYNAVLPIMVCVAVALAVRTIFSPRSIYTLKIRRRGGYLPEGLQASMRTDQCVVDIMSKKLQFINYQDLQNLTGSACVALFQPHHHIVITQNEEILGSIPKAIHQALSRSQHISVDEWIDKNYLIISSTSSIANLLRLRNLHQVETLFLSTHPKQPGIKEIVGIITANEIAESVESVANIINA
ncbi:MAG: chloride channel protein [Legionellales bacterium]|nr:chloride channel protein [Legionellales bacterium]